MKRVIVVQARMTSTRLPGKVLMDVGGKPMLVQQLRRLKRCRRADEIVLATTRNDVDDTVVALADAEGVRWFRGSENDVLSRYAGAAREAQAGLIVRITADCPLIDPGVTDRVIAALEERATECDYAANVVRRTFPKGLDAEAFFVDTLERVHRMGASRPAREHVTWFIYRERPDLFAVHSVVDDEDHSDIRWTVDTAEDLALVRRLYEELELCERDLTYRDILAHVLARPDLVEMNRRIVQRDV